MVRSLFEELTRILCTYFLTPWVSRMGYRWICTRVFRREQLSFSRPSPSLAEYPERHPRQQKLTQRAKSKLNKLMTLVPYRRDSECYRLHESSYILAPPSACHQPDIIQQILRHDMQWLVFENWCMIFTGCHVTSCALINPEPVIKIFEQSLDFFWGGEGGDFSAKWISESKSKW